MKKQLLWGILLLLAGFSSCKRDSFKPVNEESSTGKTTKVNTTQPTYTYADLALQPRQPGETFDTYKGTWSGAEVKVTGTPTWNQASYPTLVNGVPASGAGYWVYSNANSISFSTTGAQDFFTLSISAISLPNVQAFQSDLKKYGTTLEAWHKANDNLPSPDLNTYPVPYDYIKTTYTDPSNGMVNVTGKLIRVTTGSHWALASVNYPTPTPVTLGPPLFVGTIQISVNGTMINYDLFGKNGKVTGISPWNPATDPTPVVNGTYTTTSSSVVYNVDVTVTLPNAGGQVHYVGSADAS